MYFSTFQEFLKYDKVSRKKNTIIWVGIKVILTDFKDCFMSMWKVHDFSGHSERNAIVSSFAEKEKEQNQRHKR